MRIGINLYPYKEEKSNKAVGFIDSNFSIIFLIGLILALLNFLIFVIGQLSFFPAHEANKSWKKVEVKAKELEQLKNDLVVLRGKKTTYSDLVKPNISMARILDDVYSSMPKNVWLIAVDFKDKKLEFVASAVEWKNLLSESVDQFIKNLKSKEYFSSKFSKIELKGRRIMKMYGNKIIKFEVECKNPE